MKKIIYTITFLFISSFILIPNVLANNETIVQDWVDEIGNDYYQDIYRHDDKIYVLSKTTLYIYDSAGNKQTIKLDACDQGTFYKDGFICYNYSSKDFLKSFDESPYWDWYQDDYSEDYQQYLIENYYWKEEYIYDYDFNGKLVTKQLVYEGSAQKDTSATSASIDFDYISKYNENYYFFSYGELNRIVFGNTEKAREICGQNFYGSFCSKYRYVYYNEDEENYGYHDYTDYQWKTVDISEIYESSKRALDESYIYNYFWDEYSNGYSYPMTYSNLNDWYYVGYLDMKEKSYMALVHNSKTGKDINIKINGTSFFSVILGDDYFLVLDTSNDTCDSEECKTTKMTKYDYTGKNIEEETILSSSTSFMGTSVGYMYGDGFAIIAGNREEGKTSYTTSLMKFVKSPYNIYIKDPVGGEVTASKNKADYGDSVTFTVEPKEGYVLGEIKVTDANGNVITFTDYTFTMPSSDVTIEVIFKKIENPNTAALASISIAISILILSLGAVIYTYHQYGTLKTKRWQ